MLGCRGYGYVRTEAVQTRLQGWMFGRLVIRCCLIVSLVLTRWKHANQGQLRLSGVLKYLDLPFLNQMLSIADQKQNDEV